MKPWAGGAHDRHAGSVVRRPHDRGLAGCPTLDRPRGAVAAELLHVVAEEKADLIVAGGYGHSRLGEWIFGGVTRELLTASPVCCMLSH